MPRGSKFANLNGKQSIIVLGHKSHLSTLLILI